MQLVRRFSGDGNFIWHAMVSSTNHSQHLISVFNIVILYVSRNVFYSVFVEILKLFRDSLNLVTICWPKKLIFSALLCFQFMFTRQTIALRTIHEWLSCKKLSFLV